MSGKTHIQLFGTPSTSYIYIRYILQKVIERARLHLCIEEVKDIDEIVKHNVSAIPAVRLNGQTIEFTDGENFNELLKNTVLDLLKSEQYGQWPVVVLYSRQLGTAHCFAQELAKNTDAAIEWIMDDPGSVLDAMSHDLQSSIVDKLIRQRQKDWMGQIFSSPMLDYAFIDPSEQTKCVQFSAERNTIALVSDLPLEDTWHLLSDWAQSSNTPFIYINGNKAYRPIKHISVLYRSKHPKASGLLLRIVNGKKERLSFSKLHEFRTEIIQADITKSGRYSDKNDPGSHITTWEPGVYALQIEDRGSLIQFLQKDDVKRWLKELKEPLILLPPEDNEDKDDEEVGKG